MRAVVDSQAKDPYSGGAFNLEFEVSENGRFEEELAGRVRIQQLQDDAQRVAFLRVRNVVARRAGAPPPQHLAASILQFTSSTQAFRELVELETEHEFWMRFRTPEDLDDWCRLIVSELPSLVDPARRVPAHQLILGKSSGQARRRDQLFAARELDVELDLEPVAARRRSGTRRARGCGPPAR